MDLFYCSEITDSEIILSEEESKHCIRVLRLRKDDAIHLTDGRGQLSRAILLDSDPKMTRVRIVGTITGYRNRAHRLHIAIAPTKNLERFEWFLEKATEMGVDEITPMICSRSERETINFKRGERILISAMKQAQRAYVPVLNPVSQFIKVISAKGAKSKIIAHCNIADIPLISERFTNGAPAIILIGPEGDFTSDEVEIASDKGFVEASLGPFIYRTETAGIMACHAFNISFRQ